MQRQESVEQRLDLEMSDNAGYKNLLRYWLMRQWLTAPEPAGD